MLFACLETFQFAIWLLFWTNSQGSILLLFSLQIKLIYNSLDDDKLEKILSFSGRNQIFKAFQQLQETSIFVSVLPIVTGSVSEFNYFLNIFTGYSVQQFQSLQIWRLNQMKLSVLNIASLFSGNIFLQFSLCCKNMFLIEQSMQGFYQI